MDKLSCIIIDDEKNGRDVIKSLINSYCKEVSIVAESAGINEAYENIIMYNPDFILLDIQMPGGNGFELLKKFDTVNFEIIFVTSYDKYAITAFKYSAVDYLLKPVDIDDLLGAIERVKRKKNVNKFEDFEKYKYLLNNVSSDNQLKNITIQKSDKVYYLKLTDILYLEAESNYTKIYTVFNENFIQSKTLKYYEDLFNETSVFIRVNRSYLVNISQVKSYTKSEPCILTLVNGFQIELSRRKKTELIALMNRN